MKKLLSILATVGLTATTTATIVACGSKPVPQKDDLKDVVKVTSIKGDEANDQETVLAKILELNSALDVTGVELKDFKPATQTGDGSAKLVAKAGTKYQGEVSITIVELAKTVLKDVVKVTSIKGNEANTQETVLAQILELNSDSGIKESDVELKDFKPASQTGDGSAKLVAKAGTNYQGDVLITIVELAKTVLKDVIKVTSIKGNEANTQETVLAQILELNSDSGIKESDVELKDFKPASRTGDGSAKLVAKAGTKYQGDVSITIVELAKTLLSDVFAEFTFKDNHNIENFVNYNDFLNIDQQILDYLGHKNLLEAGLQVKNRTNNSIILQPTLNSEYKGEITLNWNLKLFEVWGVLTDSPIFGDTNNELKGYFYLNSNQQIEYFDAYAYFKGQSNEITKYDTLHAFEFTNENQESKIVSFLQSYKTDEIASQLGKFNLTNKTRVDIISRIATNIKIYNLKDTSWNSISDKDNILNDPKVLEIDDKGLINIL